MVAKKVMDKTDKTMMFCECCEKKGKRWDMFICKPEKLFFPRARYDGTLEFCFACPECVHDFDLVVLDNDSSRRFAERNERLREALEPQVVH